MFSLILRVRFRDVVSANTFYDITYRAARPCAAICMKGDVVLFDSL